MNTGGLQFAVRDWSSVRSRVGLALAVMVIAAIGACSSGDEPSESLQAAADDSVLEHAEKHLDPLYRCPMHPQITSDAPGKCPICGMDLVRVQEAAKSDRPRSASRHPLFYRNPMDPAITSPQPRKDEMGMDYIPVYAADLEGTVEISPLVQQNLGVRVAMVEWSPLPSLVSAVGYVRYDERSIREVRIRAAGWVERLAVRAEGDPVRRGQLLFELYSPTLATAEAEYVQALEFGDPDLVTASKRRLHALGLDASAIETLERDRVSRARLAFHAPADGIVRSLGVREGSMVTPDTLALEITALDPVWVIVEVPESSAAQVRAGARASLQAVALPGHRFTGTVDYVYPELDPMTRTLRVRIVLENAGTVLRPDMYLSAEIRGPEADAVLHVPLESVIRGGRSDRVLVALGEGRFAPREVRLGRESGDRVAVLEGLAAGEQVVTSGVFLIDSEASLRSSLARFSEESGAAAPQHQH